MGHPSKSPRSSVIERADSKAEDRSGDVGHPSKSPSRSAVIERVDSKAEDRSGGVGHPSKSPRSAVIERADVKVEDQGGIPIRRLEELLPVIRHSLNYEAGGRDASCGRVKEVFRELDLDMSGTLDRDEFRRGLDILGVDVLPEECDVVFRRCDHTGSGQMDLCDFMDLLDGTVMAEAKSG